MIVIKNIKATNIKNIFKRPLIWYFNENLKQKKMILFYIFICSKYINYTDYTFWHSDIYVVILTRMFPDNAVVSKNKFSQCKLSKHLNIMEMERKVNECKMIYFINGHIPFNWDIFKSAVVRLNNSSLSCQKQV